MLSLLRDGPERAIAGARGPIKHAHSDLKRDHSFVASAARLIKDVLLDMAWDVLLHRRLWQQHLPRASARSRRSTSRANRGNRSSTWPTNKLMNYLHQPCKSCLQICVALSNHGNYWYVDEASGSGALVAAIRYVDASKSSCVGRGLDGWCFYYQQFQRRVTQKADPGWLNRYLPTLQPRCNARGRTRSLGYALPLPSQAPPPGP